MKSKIIVCVAVILVTSITALTLFLTRYMWDVNDTEESYKENVQRVGYDNTIDTAIPQTEIYNAVVNHFKSELPDGKTVKKAIIIGYDGCRADILAEKQNGSSGIEQLLEDGANINLAYCGGVNYPSKPTQDTSTAPGWCSILTGKWANEHGITGNNMNKSMATKTLLTSLTEEKVIDEATFITRWAGHFSRKNSTYKLEKEYCEEKGLGVSFNKCKDDEASFEATINELEKADCADFTFVIYEPTDSTGHGKGFSFNNPKYKEAYKKADQYGYETIMTIKDRPSYATEDWLIIITSDHGGIKTNHGRASIQERMTFIVMNKEW